MSDEPRKSKARRKVEVLTERQRKLDADVLAAKLELKLEDESEKEQHGAVAFVACVRRLDSRRLDSLKAVILTDFGGDDAQLGLVKNWFDNFTDAPSTHTVTTLSDKAEVSTTGTPSAADVTAVPIREPDASDSASLPKNTPSENPILPTGEASAKPGENHHQADAAQANATRPPEPAAEHDGPQASAAVAAQPMPTKEDAVGTGDHVQAGDKANPSDAPSEVPSDALARKPLATEQAEEQPSVTPSEDLSVISQEIKDRLWRGEYLIEVEQKGGCQVIGMEAFGSPEDAMEHLARLEEGARNGDESAKRVLATAAKAASEYR